MRMFVIAAIATVLTALPSVAQDHFVEQDTQRWGGDYTSFEMASGGAPACANACSSDGRCEAWTYARPGTEAVGGVCHLKETVPHRVANNCCESGVVVGVEEEARPAYVRRGQDSPRETASLD